MNCTLEQPGDGIASHVLRNGTAEPISNSSYNFGAVVELECIDGYKVVGVTSIYCNQEFDWSGELGTCESKQKFLLISACLCFLSLLSVVPVPVECA